MRRISFCAACILVPAFAAGAHAQPADCGDVANENGNGVYAYATIGVPIADAPALVDSVLAHYGYGAATRSRDAEGRAVWRAGPNYVFVEGLDFPRARGVRNPGLGAEVNAREFGRDSTMLEILVRVACQALRDGERSQDAETSLTSLNSAILRSGLEDRARALQPGGLQLDVPAEDGAPHRLRAPPSAAGFVIAGRYEHEDPAEGVLLRYARGPGLFLYLELAPGVPRRCDAACAAGIADARAASERERLVRLTESGYYAHAEMVGDETLPAPAGAPWRLGRHQVAAVEVRGGEARMDSYTFVYPGYRVGVYATYPPSEEMTRAVRAFVDEVLPTLVPRS